MNRIRETSAAYHSAMRTLKDIEVSNTEMRLLIDHTTANECGAKILAYCEAHGLEDQYTQYNELYGQAMYEIEGSGIDGEVSQRQRLLELCREHDIDQTILNIVEEEIEALKRLKIRRAPRIITEALDATKDETIAWFFAFLPYVITAFVWLLIFDAFYWWVTS